jgi:hypothetical protein
MYDRFLDGYQHALDGNTAMNTAGKYASKVSAVSTLSALANPAKIENTVYAAQAAAAGWGQGAAAFAPAAAAEMFTIFLLEDLAFRGAAEVGKITAGVTNMYFDAY